MSKRLPAIPIAIAVWLAYTTSLFAQISVDVSVIDAKTTVSTAIVTTTTIEIGGVSSSSESVQPGTVKESATPVGVISAVLIDGLTVNAFDTDFMPADLAKQDGNPVWTISKPGKYLVILQATGQPMAFRQLIIPGTIDPPPKPDDPIPPDVVIPNEMGVGAIAFRSAPKSPVVAKVYATKYRQAADSLFKAPLKAIIAPGDRYYGDPNRDVLAWIAKETADPIWDNWNLDVGGAIVESQQSRISAGERFTRESWFKLFTEIATALEAVK